MHCALAMIKSLLFFHQVHFVVIWGSNNTVAFVLASIETHSEQKKVTEVLSNSLNKQL